MHTLHSICKVDKGYVFVLNTTNNKNVGVARQSPNRRAEYWLSGVFSTFFHLKRD